MLVTYLGHAGFCVETSRVTVVMDPWLSPTGAFDCSWFQLPRNHHLADLVAGKLADSGKERFLYISHEHKDHLDIDYLCRLACRDFTIVVPCFRRDALRSMLADYGCRRLISCSDEQVVPIPGGFLKSISMTASFTIASQAFVASTASWTFLPASFPARPGTRRVTSSRTRNTKQLRPKSFRANSKRWRDASIRCNPASTYLQPAHRAFLTPG